MVIGCTMLVYHTLEFLQQKTLGERKKTLSRFAMCI